MSADCIVCGSTATVNGTGTMSDVQHCLSCWMETVREENFEHGLGVYH